MASALRRPLAAFALAAALAAGSALVLREPAPVLSPGEPAPARLPETSRFALLAVGDTGETLPFRPFAEGQRSVARGLELEDRRAPVDALLLLGDNFYPKGLAEDELLERLRRNLVGPYCRFVDLRGSRSAEVADACRLPPAQRHPVPIFAVLGNHDHGLPESPALQQRAIPHYLPNWSLPAALASTTELAEGLSLVRIDSELARRAPERLGELRDAFARARGPWRILALHHPIAPRVGEDESDGFEADLRELLAELPEPVQLVLAGHRHNLQILTPTRPRPALHVIAGSGSSRKPFGRHVYAERRFGIETTGFARVELLSGGGVEGLRVSLYTVPRYPIVFWAEPRLVTSWWVDRAGRAAQILPRPGAVGVETQSR